LYHTFTLKDKQVSKNAHADIFKLFTKTPEKAILRRLSDVAFKGTTADQYSCQKRRFVAVLPTVTSFNHVPVHKSADQLILCNEKLTFSTGQRTTIVI
jgi:hypothetical protein